MGRVAGSDASGTSLGVDLDPVWKRKRKKENEGERERERGMAVQAVWAAADGRRRRGPLADDAGGVLAWCFLKEEGGEDGRVIAELGSAVEEKGKVREIEEN